MKQATGHLVIIGGAEDRQGDEPVVLSYTRLCEAMRQAGCLPPRR